jgi:hypothetical protein
LVELAEHPAHATKTPTQSAEMSGRLNIWCGVVTLFSLHEYDMDALPVAPRAQ